MNRKISEVLSQLLPVFIDEVTGDLHHDPDLGRSQNDSVKAVLKVEGFLLSVQNHEHPVGPEMNCIKGMSVEKMS